MNLMNKSRDIFLILFYHIFLRMYMLKDFPFTYLSNTKKNEKKREKSTYIQQKKGAWKNEIRFLCENR